MDMKAPADDLGGYLEVLRGFSFVRAATLRAAPDGLPVDATLVVRTPTETFRLPARRTRSLLGRDVAEHLAGLAQRIPGLVVLTPAVGRFLGDFLAKHGVNFVDLAGNCSLRLGGSYQARIQGRARTSSRTTEKALRAPAYRVLFALLARSELLDAPARTLAEAAGDVSPQTAIDLRKRLVARGDVLASGNGHQWAPAGLRRATEFWLAGFSATLFPGLSLGRFHTQEKDLRLLGESLGKRLGDARSWRWGGGAAAQRLTGYYRGPRTVIYFASAPPTPARKLGLVPSADGDVWLARSPGPAAFTGSDERCVHPLLVYADLLAEADDRAREAAAELRNRFLPELESGAERHP